MVYVWYVKDPAKVEIYAMTHAEAFSIFEKLADGKHLQTESWQIKGGYSLQMLEARSEKFFNRIE